MRDVIDLKAGKEGRFLLRHTHREVAVSLSPACGKSWGATGPAESGQRKGPSS